MRCFSSRLFFSLALTTATATTAIVIPTPAAADHRPEIENVLSPEFDPEGPGASVIALKDGVVEFRKGYGLADIELGTAVTPEMVFRIGSVTKSFTALAVMMLSERDALSLDDNVRTYLPGLPQTYDSVTIRHLLSHTAGVPDLFDEAYYTLIEERASDLLNDELEPQVFVDLFADRELDFEPGTSFGYSNSGYFLLGRIIEEVSGKSYSTFIRQEIVAPLGLANTYYYSSTRVIPGRVASYLDDDSGVIRNPFAGLSGAIVYSAGGLMSSVDDLARLNTALDSGELIGTDSGSEMFVPATDTLGSDRQYGLGYWLGSLKGKRCAWHGGDVYGFSATILRVPEEAIFVAIMSNDPRINSRTLDRLARKVAAVLMGDPFQEWVQVHLSPEQLQRIAGEYRVNVSSVRKVIVEGDRIFTQRDGGPKIEVFAASDSLFFYPNSLVYLTFESDQDGNVTQMVMHRDSGIEEPAAREPH